MRENLTPRLLSILLGSKADLDRNAHSETREPGSTVSVDWASAILPGKLRDFLASVVRTIYFNGNASAASRLLNAVFDCGYVGDPNSITLTKGSKAGRFGAIPSFLFGAPPAAAAAALRKWEAMANMGLSSEDQQQVFFCNQVFGVVNSVPSKCGHEQSYAARLSDGFVSDASIMKITAGVHHAATHASQDGDQAKSAKIVAMFFHLAEEESRQNAHVYFNTVGEIGSKALASNIVDGRTFGMWASKATVTRASAYVFVRGLHEGDGAKESVAGWVAMKLKIPKTAVEMAPPRTQRNVMLDGTAALSVTNSAIKALLALGTPVPGTINTLNATVEISTHEAASMMVGPETTRVFVSVSLSLLKDSLIKAGEEVNKRQQLGGDHGAARPVRRARRRRPQTARSSWRRPWRP